jgi:hypothetical protein
LAQADLPQHIQTHVVQYESALTQNDYDDPRFSYRVTFVRKTSNAKQLLTASLSSSHQEPTQRWGSNKVLLKETDKKKYGAKSIVKQMRAEGFTRFTLNAHTELWQSRDA